MGGLCAYVLVVTCDSLSYNYLLYDHEVTEIHMNRLLHVCIWT